MNPNMADVAALVGDPARATMLTSLLDGRSLTALELACSAGVTPQTASFHLLKMTQKDLLTAVKQGRHRYYKLATPLVAHMLEGIMAVAANVSAKPVPPPRVDADMKRARTCYDHTLPAPLGSPSQTRSSTAATCSSMMRPAKSQSADWISSAGTTS